MIDINFAILQPRELISSTKFTNNQDEDLLHFSFGPSKQNKQAINEVQDKYDDRFALKRQTNNGIIIDLEPECPITTNLQKAMTTVDEEGSKFFSSL